MNADVKARWIAALRSGNYNQTRGCLGAINTETGSQAHCCLGVLCEILSIPSQRKATDVHNVVELAYGNPNELPERAILPTSAQEAAGLDAANPSAVTVSGLDSSLAELNDMGKTFDEIADIIEAQLHPLPHPSHFDPTEYVTGL